MREMVLVLGGGKQGNPRVRHALGCVRLYAKIFDRKKAGGELGNMWNAAADNSVGPIGQLKKVLAEAGFRASKFDD